MPDPKLLTMLDQIEADYPAEEYPEVDEALQDLRGAMEEAQGGMPEDEELDMAEAPDEELEPMDDEEMDDEELDMMDEEDEDNPGFY